MRGFLGYQRHLSSCDYGEKVSTIGPLNDVFISREDSFTESCRERERSVSTITLSFVTTTVPAGVSGRHGSENDIGLLKYFGSLVINYSCHLFPLFNIELTCPFHSSFISDSSGQYLVYFSPDLQGRYY